MWSADVPGGSGCYGLPPRRSVGGPLVRQPRDSGLIPLEAYDAVLKHCDEQAALVGSIPCASEDDAP
jgi:hypothetical protein